MRPVGCHRIGGSHGTQGHRVLIGTLITHHAHTPDGRKENGTSLPDLVIEGFSILTDITAETTDIDIVSILKDTYLLGGNITEDTNGKTRTRERMTGNQMLRHTELTTHTAHLILKQPLQGFTELQMHLLGQSTHIMVTLDHLTRDIQRLDTVGINRALCQPFGIGNLLGLSIENLHEITTNNFALLLRISHTLKVTKELLTGIHTDYIESQHLIVVHHLTELILTEHTVIHEDACQVTAYRTVEQYGSHRRIDTTGESENHSVITQLSLQLCHSRVNK